MFTNAIVGYTKYGKTASLSIASNYEKAWEKLTGIFDYNRDTIGNIEHAHYVESYYLLSQNVRGGGIN